MVCYIVISQSENDIVLVTSTVTLGRQQPWFLDQIDRYIYL